MVIYIKNMVSTRCKLVVKAELEKLGLHAVRVELGEAEIEEDLPREHQYLLDIALKKCGLEILEGHKSILIEKIKKTIIELVRDPDIKLKLNMSGYLSEKLNYNYTYLNNIFYKAKGLSIEKYLIHQRIEKVKELLAYHELNLTEIAYQLHYSSIAHLSNQFKKITGLSPSEYRQKEHIERLGVDEV